MKKLKGFILSFLFVFITGVATSNVVDNFTYQHFEQPNNIQTNAVDLIYHNGFESAPVLLAPPAVIQTSATPDFLSDTVGNTAGSFRVDESGAATYSIEIMAPQGTGGLAPTISLDYSSLASNGIAGVGWNLSGSIQYFALFAFGRSRWCGSRSQSYQFYQ